MIRNFLVPKFYLSFIFAKFYSGQLKKIDIMVRMAIRKIHHLPHDLLNFAFHAKMADGFMGIRALKYLISLIAKNRLVHRIPHPNLLKIENQYITSTRQINNNYIKQRYKMCDGVGLKQSSRCPNAHQWISDGTNFL